jgi:hypothetical protein
MRIGLTAAGVLAVLLLALVHVTNGRARLTTAHTCSATDRQFIETARTNMTALELWSEQYQSGDASGQDVERQARSASKIVGGTGPTDAALQQARLLVIGMLSEYAKAVQQQEHHRDAGPHVYRAYRLANFAHTVLVRAQAPLTQLGCDVSPLL